MRDNTKQQCYQAALSQTLMVHYLSFIQFSCPVPPPELSQLSLQAVTVRLAASELFAGSLQAQLPLPLLLLGTNLSEAAKLMFAVISSCLTCLS